MPGFKATRYSSGLILRGQQGNWHFAPLREFGERSMKKIGAQARGEPGGISEDSPKPK